MTEQAVLLEELTSTIVQITMQDRVTKNAFSPELSGGLIGAFEIIKHNPQWKVAILTGFDSYFASGGTQQSLLDIQGGKKKFTEVNLYSLAMDCEIPVISAMQGHGIGGGFVMGLYADFVILSQESIYATNFMRYGFTPGMGATYILPKKLGVALGQEMMMSANNFRGIDLAKRGVPFAVLPRAQVLTHARELAESIADKPRKSMVELKRHLVKKMRTELDEVIQEEVQLHEVTFHDDEVKDRIHAIYGQA